MTKDKYSEELHEVIDVLNKHRQQMTIVMSAFVFPLILVMIVGIYKFAAKLPETDRQLKDEIKEVKHGQEIDQIHIKRLYLYTFSINPYERGSIIHK